MSKTIFFIIASFAFNGFSQSEKDSIQIWVDYYIEYDSCNYYHENFQNNTDIKIFEDDTLVYQKQMNSIPPSLSFSPFDNNSFIFKRNHTYKVIFDDNYNVLKDEFETFHISNNTKIIRRISIFDVCHIKPSSKFKLVLNGNGLGAELIQDLNYLFCHIPNSILELHYTYINNEYESRLKQLISYIEEQGVIIKEIELFDGRELELTNDEFEFKIISLGTTE